MNEFASTIALLNQVIEFVWYTNMDDFDFRVETRWSAKMQDPIESGAGDEDHIRFLQGQ